MTIEDIDVATEKRLKQVSANPSWAGTADKEKKRAAIAEARAAAAKRAHKKKISKRKRRSRPALERSNSFESIRSCCTLTPIEETEYECTEADASLQKVKNEYPYRGTGDFTSQVQSPTALRPEQGDPKRVLDPTGDSARSSESFLGSDHSLTPLALVKGDLEMGLDPTDDSVKSAESSLTSTFGGRYMSDGLLAPDGSLKCGLAWSKRRCMVVSVSLLVMVLTLIVGVAIVGSRDVDGSSTSTVEATRDFSTEDLISSLNTPVLDENSVIKSIYLNAGAHPTEVYKGFQGVEWISDNDFLSGYGQVYNACPDKISTGTFDPDLFCTERWFRDMEGYDIRVARDRATYQVIMHFSEVVHTSAKKREFDIYIENKVVRSGFDIYAEAGGNGIAVALLTEAIVADGELSIRFVPIPGSSNPKVNAIEVHHISKARNSSDYDAVAAEPVNEQVPSAPIDEETLNKEVDVEDFEDEAPTAGLTVFSVPFFINAGGISFTDEGGINWVSDSLSMANIGASVSKYEQCSSGENDDLKNVTNPRELIYCSERWFQENSVGTYELPLRTNNVELKVTLHFAELFFTKVGQRVFDVKVEGQMVRRGYDILADTGGAQLVGTTLTKNVWVTDESLSINLFPQVGNPKISAIEVHAV